MATSLLVATPTEMLSLQLVRHPLLDEPRRLHRRAEQLLGAGEIDVGLVQAHPLHQGEYWSSMAINRLEYS